MLNAEGEAVTFFSGLDLEHAGMSADQFLQRVRSRLPQPPNPTPNVRIRRL